MTNKDEYESDLPFYYKRLAFYSYERKLSFYQASCWFIRAYLSICSYFLFLWFLAFNSATYFGLYKIFPIFSPTDFYFNKVSFSSLINLLIGLIIGTASIASLTSNPKSHTLINGSIKFRQLLNITGGLIGLVAGSIAGLHGGLSTSLSCLVASRSLLVAKSSKGSGRRVTSFVGVIGFFSSFSTANLVILLQQNVFLALKYCFIFSFLFALAVRLFYFGFESLSAKGRQWLSISFVNGIGVCLGVSLVNGLSIGILSGLIAAIGYLTAGIGPIFMRLSIELLVDFIINLYNFILLFAFLPYLFYKYFLMKKMDFANNPYREQLFGRLPVPGAVSRLTRLAKSQPQAAENFVVFLLKNREKQRDLAMHIRHAATAGKWQQRPTSADVLSGPAVPLDMPNFNPSYKWTKLLISLKEQLISSEKQSNIQQKKNAYKDYLNILKALNDQTLLESPKWNKYYFEAIDKRRDVAFEEFKKLELQASSTEPITKNIYRPGEALRPGHEAIFLGRGDFKEKLSLKILTATAMPMFLIQGQRRVGKTSLLNFLPQILGPRFKIIYQDMQNGRACSVIDWMKDLRELANEQLCLKSDNWSPSGNWLAAWNELRLYLETISKDHEFKIILAIDEYECLHHNLQENIEEAKKLLGAMRSFTQHQNDTVFLFVGAKFFTELNNPNWNEYLVQSVTLKVDYLEKDDALKLITAPVEDFNLKYPPEIANQIFELTQGHPALLQLICRELVDIVNQKLRGFITLDDLTTAIKKTINRETHAINIFWTEFCRPVDRATIRDILENRQPANLESLFKLKEHGYISEDKRGLRIRVPLIEMWIREYADTFLC